MHEDRPYDSKIAYSIIEKQDWLQNFSSVVLLTSLSKSLNIALTFTNTFYRRADYKQSMVKSYCIVLQDTLCCSQWVPVQMYQDSIHFKQDPLVHYNGLLYFLK